MLTQAKLFVALALFGAARMAAQVQPDSTAPEARVIVAATSREDGTLFILRTLRQVDRPVSRPHLDATADSLVAFVLRTPPTEEKIEALNRAVHSLGLSAMNDGPGVRYAGAAIRLLKIAELGDVVDAGAVSYLSRLPDRAEAVALLRRCAMMGKISAFVAVRNLEATTGPEGLLVLRQLYQSRQIHHPVALEHAEGVARRLNWAPPRPR